jgi:hypothetical protein
MATWEPLLESLRKRLGVWGDIYLLNAVLNAIPVFYLSFLKILVQVWKKIRRLQREFLWGGRRGRKKKERGIGRKKDALMNCCEKYRIGTQKKLLC